MLHRAVHADGNFGGWPASSTSLRDSADLAMYVHRSDTKLGQSQAKTKEPSRVVNLEDRPRCSTIIDPRWIHGNVAVLLIHL